MTVYAHVSIARAVKAKIIRGPCPDCKRQRSAFVVVHYDSEFYGPSQTCLRCGRRWEDGEWMALDSVRGSRQKSIDSARKAWRLWTRQKSSR